MSLRYGQVVALAGDFFGFPDRAISSDPSGAVFVDAFNLLATDPAANATVLPILKTMQTEIDAGLRKSHAR